MRTAVCIACVKSKRPDKSRVGELYTSTLFTLSLRYARSLHPDQIFVLSAKHGLLDLTDEIEPYEQTLKETSKAARLAWAERVLQRLKERTDLENDEFIFLAGERYRENLVPHIRHWSVPMKGLAFGEQLRWLAKQVGR